MQERGGVGKTRKIDWSMSVKPVSKDEEKKKKKDKERST